MEYVNTAKGCKHGASNADQKKQEEEDICNQWTGFLDLQNDSMNWSGIINSVESSLIRYNKRYKNSWSFICAQFSKLSIFLKPPKEKYIENKKVEAALNSVLHERGIVQIVLDFLKWYGATLTLSHLCSAMVSGNDNNCWINVWLRSHSKKDATIVETQLANRFPPNSGKYVKHSIFIPKEMLLDKDLLRLNISLNRDSRSHYWLKSIEISGSTEQESKN